MMYGAVWSYMIHTAGPRNIIITHQMMYGAVWSYMIHTAGPRNIIITIINYYIIPDTSHPNIPRFFLSGTPIDVGGMANLDREGEDHYILDYAIVICINIK